MADIALCSIQDCRQIATCKRAQAMPNPYGQSWLLYDPRSPDGACAQFQPAEEEKK